MPTTPKYALRYPASTDTADIPRDVGNLATDVDNLLGINGALTTPPASPVDGQLWTFVADATNGVVWTFRYRAASSSAYKWEFVGGSPLFTAAASVVNFGTTPAVILALTAPRAGEYMGRGAYRFTLGSTTARNVWAGIKAGAAGSTVAVGSVYAPSNVGSFSVGVEDKVVATAAQAVNLSAMANASAAPFDTSIDGWLSLVPVRVS